MRQRIPGSKAWASLGLAALFGNILPAALTSLLTLRIVTALRTTIPSLEPSETLFYSIFVPLYFISVILGLLLREVVLSYILTADEWLLMHPDRYRRGALGRMFRQFDQRILAWKIQRESRRPQTPGGSHEAD